jgi:PAS domain S-box-containing protein
MREIKTLSSDSETATIALSLSEGSLGVIKMVNPQAAFIFGYLKSEISKLRVNDIMPKTIARHHDDILLSYLSHRNKMVNTDERQMIGKSKNGYVFPIILQLQSAIASAN